jgi:hypothetical protein
MFNYENADEPITQPQVSFKALYFKVLYFNATYFKALYFKALYFDALYFNVMFNEIKTNVQTRFEILTESVDNFGFVFEVSNIKTTERITFKTMP